MSLPHCEPPPSRGEDFVLWDGETSALGGVGASCEKSEHCEDCELCDGFVVGDALALTMMSSSGHGSWGQESETV